jgi:chaperonin GroEL (HSP60 family)
MSSKPALFDSAAREELLRGVTTSSDAVRVTLGPQSKRVILPFTEATVTELPEPSKPAAHREAAFAGDDM